MPEGSNPSSRLASSGSSARPRIDDGALATFRMLAVLTRQPMLLRLLRVDPVAIASYSSALDEALRAADPELAARLARAGVTADLFFYGWAQPLLVRSLPLRVAMRVWDGLLCLGTPFLFVAALAVLRCLRPVLMAASDDDCMAVVTGGSFSTGFRGAAWRRVTEATILAALRKPSLKAATHRAIVEMEAHMPQPLPPLPPPRLRAPAPTPAESTRRSAPAPSSTASLVQLAQRSVFGSLT